MITCEDIIDTKLVRVARLRMSTNQHGPNQEPHNRGWLLASLGDDIRGWLLWRYLPDTSCGALIIVFPWWKLKRWPAPRYLRFFTRVAK